MNDLTYRVSHRGSPRVIFDIFHPNGVAGFAFVRPELAKSAINYSEAPAERVATYERERFAHITAFFPYGIRHQGLGNAGAGHALLASIVSIAAGRGQSLLYVQTSRLEMQSFLVREGFDHIESTVRIDTPVEHYIRAATPLWSVPRD